MNRLQKIVINSYMEINRGSTLKEISSDTGIQLTRVFRLLNGSEMKISEYEKFMERTLKCKKNNLDFFSSELDRGEILPLDKLKLEMKSLRLKKISLLKQSMMA